MRMTIRTKAALLDRLREEQRTFIKRSGWPDLHTVGGAVGTCRYPMDVTTPHHSHHHYLPPRHAASRGSDVMLHTEAEGRGGAVEVTQAA